MVGVFPYTPDLLIEAIVDSDSVTITLPDYFRRPLRLTAEQTFALLTSAKALLSVPGADTDSALARGLAKVLDSIGETSETAVDIDLDTAPDAVTELLRHLIEARHSVDITYYTYGRDDIGSRRIDPWSIHSEAGLWYVQAWCHRSTAGRVFRIDRILEASPTSDRFTMPEPLPPFTVFDSGSIEGSVTLHLAPSARWVIEYYPAESVEVHDDGSSTITFAIGSVPWLERLLIRLGPDATVLEASEGLAEVGRNAARRLLATYRD